ncbi:MAG TPA: hypothetical protein VGI23_11290 [Steroidobacteraceae bacterium]
MVTGVSLPGYGSHSAYPSSTGGDSVSALEGRIQQARVQLDDWTTCVSSSTPKGQAAIQKLSGEISADKQKIAQAQQSQPTYAANAPTSSHSATATGSGARLIDVWA